MLIILKLLLLLCLLAISYQDFKERKVYLWLLLLAVGLLGYLHYLHSVPTQFLRIILLNIGIVVGIVFILYLYAKFKLKLALQETFGFGDLLFFIAIAVGFPTISFIVLFSFSLFFTLVTYLILKKGLQQNTVPLAGLQALFFSLIFLLNWAFHFINIYQF